jgi:hypothetical protein
MNEKKKDGTTVTPGSKLVRCPSNISKNKRAVTRSTYPVTDRYRYRYRQKHVTSGFCSYLKANQYSCPCRLELMTSRNKNYNIRPAFTQISIILSITGLQARTVPAELKQL